MFDATSLLGGMLANSFGKRLASAALPGTGFSTTTKVAAGAAGVAAVGGLGYLAYRHFQQRPATPQLGAPTAPGGAGPGLPTGGGFLEGIVGSSTGLQRGNFSVPGYEWQTGGGAAPEAPPAAAAPFAPAVSTRVAPAEHAPPPPAATMTSDQYRALPDRPQSAYAASPDFPSTTAPAPSAEPAGTDQAHALLLVRVMVAAANADGVIEDGERSNILNHLGSAGLSQAEIDGLARELDAPRPITALVGEISSPDLAEQAYVVSLLAMSFQEGPSDAEKAYARMLPALLQLPPEKLQEIHAKLGFPAL